jgi:predicted TIM-barrel fold metal-dependent hydrolase
MALKQPVTKDELNKIKEILQTERLTVGVETMVTSAPSQCGTERSEQVEQDPRQNHHVVYGAKCDYDESAVAQTLEKRCHPAIGFVGTQSRKLPDEEFSEENWQANYEYHNQEWYKKSA